MNVDFIQDVDQAIRVFREAGQWLLDSGKQPSKWWRLEHLNQDFLFQFATPDEFYVGLVDEHPVVAAILQLVPETTEWDTVNQDCPQSALYVHWLCVARGYAGMDMPKKMICFATVVAKEKGVSFVRVDTDAREEKLRGLYETMGFDLVGIKKEDYRDTALYQIAS